MFQTNLGSSTWTEVNINTILHITRDQKLIFSVWINKKVSYHLPKIDYCPTCVYIYDVKFATRATKLYLSCRVIFPTWEASRQFSHWDGRYSDDNDITWTLQYSGNEILMSNKSFNLWGIINFDVKTFVYPSHCTVKCNQNMYINVKVTNCLNPLRFMLKQKYAKMLMSECQKLQFFEQLLEACSRSESVPTEPHIIMPSFTAGL